MYACHKRIIEDIICEDQVLEYSNWRRASTVQEFYPWGIPRLNITVVEFSTFLLIVSHFGTPLRGLMEAHTPHNSPRQ